MKKTRYIGISITLALLLACGLLGSLGKGRGVVQAKDDEGSAGQIEGTWSVIVTPPAGGPPAYLSIASFADGGVLLTSPDSSGPAATSTGQGTWEKTKGQQFISTHVAFIYGPGGSITGAIKINSSYQLTGKDSFEGRGQLHICDASVNNCFTVPGCATLQGTRIKAEPPSCP